LNKKEYENVSISIFDEEGKMINSYTNDSEAEEDTNEYNMQLSKFTVIKTSNVTRNKGYNRFRWDLRHQGIVGSEKGKNLRGPLVKPGKYKVQLAVDQRPILTEEFVVVKDPNEDTPGASLEQLEEFQLKLVDKIKEANQLAEEINLSISKKKSKKRKSASLERTLGQLETKEGTYRQPMLIDQLRYLYGMTTRADQALGQDAFDRFAELTAQFDEIKKQL
jgi:hypothetical protein